MEDRPYKYTVKCRSLYGELYTIPIHVFKDVLLQNQETQQYMETAAIQKKAFLENRADNAKLFKQEANKSRNTSCHSTYKQRHHRQISVDISYIRDGKAYIKALDKFRAMDHSEANNNNKTLNASPESFTLAASPCNGQQVLLPKIVRTIVPEKHKFPQTPRAELFSQVKCVFQKAAATLGSPVAKTGKRYSFTQKARNFTLRLEPIVKKATL